MERTPSAEVESRIVEATRALVVEIGAGSVSQRKVAERAGVSPQSIYNRFGSKHDLLDEVAYLGFLQLTERLLEEDGVPLDAFVDPLENIVEGLARYRRFAIANPAIYGLMLDAEVAGFRVSDRTMETAFASLGVLVDAVRRAVDAEMIRPVDALDGAQRLWAAAHGVLRFELTEVGFIEDWSSHFDATVRTMLHGMR